MFSESLLAVLRQTITTRLCVDYLTDLNKGTPEDIYQPQVELLTNVGWELVS